MNAKAAAGLIVLTAVGTFVLAHPRRHHFEPTKFEGGAVLLDAETGVLCSGRVGLKWSDADKKAVWAAGLAAKKAETEYYAFDGKANGHIDMPAGLDHDSLPYPTAVGSPCDRFLRNEQREKCDGLFIAMRDADSKYDALVQKADSEKVPDPDSSYFKNLPLCKELR